MSYTQSYTHFPAQNPSRLHIQASGEVGPEQMDKLDITRQIEFKKHRSNFIGEGRHSQVYRGWYTQSSGEKLSVAVKVPMCTPQSRRDVEERLMREIITWKRVSREEDVADFMGIYRAPNEPPYLILPYYKNNNLLQYMATRSPDERLARAKEIARGLDLLHSNHVIHGDLKLVRLVSSNYDCGY
ncbi:kinase-like protein [Athelia psychrophila]|uniref:Kinase-like protein n=1 Tax=Athelia psychrophila TaxID=1759441 RepID=A0A166GTN6_9AGAM|nr:kinase-like protein [Fibularhizoctonia sp. CBS 109695]